ncbi:thymidylate kinase [Neolewinella xylanilytica]|uniref:Thymidylate kinase n=1 Tax=Neolewinella xylanilytica TaxID=1514080 RepID=A0A2S6I8J5_9BACT|nr:phosphotransferase [Neolewinella xylanilytica]PPK87826.1 thymidylate kinase [Neolewinella xylanilytica]
MKSVSLTTPVRIAGQPVRVLFIANPDGRPRWVWPADARRPTFLSFYPAVTLRQRAFRLAVRLIFMLGLQRLVFSSVVIDRPEMAGESDWALFTGTTGPNRKEVLIRDRQTVVKIAVGPDSQDNLANEARTLKKLEGAKTPLPFVYPNLVHYADHRLSITRLADYGTWDTITPDHIEALRSLRAGFSEQGGLHTWPEWIATNERLTALEAGSDTRIPGRLLTDLLVLAAAFDPVRPVRYGLSHGDFTPWNTLRTDGRQLGIIDWELAREQTPVGYDYFHFHLQQGIMVERKSWSRIYADIHAGLTPLVKLAVFGSIRVNVDRYLRLYLLHHLTYYLSVYTRQEVWHPQIHWQLEVWRDALGDLTPSGHGRPQLIASLFAALAGVDYAVLKLGDGDPADLPPDSDLDILLSRTAAETLIARIQSFRGVDRVRIVRKSFMASLAIVLSNGQLLHLDLIWKLKRKATVFLEAATLIEGARVNAHGIRVVNERDTADYLRLFYGLNGQPIPEKYAVPGGELPVLPIQSNRGWQKWRNRFDYVQDTLLTAWRDRGFVVTFSGVDGAGKSTVIGEVTQLIDKRIRRPVKVLRHRPSVLPILSAYVHGKEGAEQRSVERLPRTGNNRNLLSSLLRFGYYFTDYLFGQAYVYVRYVLRGYAVVYDRYYYDFVLDARRSNIELPAIVPRLGLPLLMKPRYNFFLYADPDTILARKQELDRATIVDLTNRYRALFRDCQDRYPRHVFASVENVELAETLATVRETLQTSIK